MIALSRLKRAALLFQYHQCLKLLCAYNIRKASLSASHPFHVLLPTRKSAAKLFTTSASNMAVPPRFSGHKMSFLNHSVPAVPRAKHTLELFLDYCCPFSAKMYNTIFNTVIPIIRKTPAYSARIELVFRQQIQPWHPSSTLMHEAALAVLVSRPEKFWDFSAQLFEHQKEYFDVSVANEPRNQTYERLAKLASDKCGLDADEMMDMLRIPDKPGSSDELNGGNKVTGDVKMVVKMARLVGIHVSPSVIFDGVLHQAISSSWGEEQWRAFLQEHCGEQ